jgi:hypothetical protein
LEDAVRLFFGGDHIAQFIQIEHRDAGIVLDQAVEVLGFGQFGIQVKEGQKNGLEPLKMASWHKAVAMWVLPTPAGPMITRLEGFFSHWVLRNSRILSLGILGLKVQSKSLRSLIRLMPDWRICDPFNLKACIIGIFIRGKLGYPNQGVCRKKFGKSIQLHERGIPRQAVYD